MAELVSTAPTLLPTLILAQVHVIFVIFTPPDLGLRPLAECGEDLH